MVLVLITMMGTSFAQKAYLGLKFSSGYMFDLGPDLGHGRDMRFGIYSIEGVRPENNVGFSARTWLGINKKEPKAKVDNLYFYLSEIEEGRYGYADITTSKHGQFGMEFDIDLYSNRGILFPFFGMGFYGESYTTDLKYGLYEPIDTCVCISDDSEVFSELTSFAFSFNTGIKIKPFDFLVLDFRVAYALQNAVDRIPVEGSYGIDQMGQVTVAYNPNRMAGTLTFNAGLFIGFPVGKEKDEDEYEYEEDEKSSSRKSWFSIRLRSNGESGSGDDENNSSKENSEEPASSSECENPIILQPTTPPEEEEEIKN